MLACPIDEFEFLPRNWHGRLPSLRLRMNRNGFELIKNRPKFGRIDLVVSLHCGPLSFIFASSICAWVDFFLSVLNGEHLTYVLRYCNRIATPARPGFGTTASIRAICSADLRAICSADFRAICSASRRAICAADLRAIYAADLLEEERGKRGNDFRVQLQGTEGANLREDNLGAGGK